MLPCMSRRAAPTLNATGPEKEASFCKKPCLASMHPLSVCACMPALVVAVLIAYDYERARKLSASLFLGSQKQAFLASWLWALIVYISACRFIGFQGGTVFFVQRSFLNVCLPLHGLCLSLVFQS